MKIPKKLEEFLEGLSDADAREIWVYFDEMETFGLIDTIALSHEKLCKEMCNPPNKEKTETKQNAKPNKTNKNPRTQSQTKPANQRKERKSKTNKR